MLLPNSGLPQQTLNESSINPNIHYAQFQTLPKGKLHLRRLYDFEILYVSKGIAATEMRGERYTLKEGDLIFLASGEYHQNEIVTTNASLIGIHFDFFGELKIATEEDIIISELEPQLEKIASEPKLFPFSQLSSEPLYRPTAQCIQLMSLLVQEFSARAPGYELICRGLMLQILTLLLRSQITRRFEDLSEHTLQIKKLMTAIQESPEQDWSNPLLAKQMNLHEDYMAKLFKSITGYSPKAFISITRHHLARKLLRETNMSIAAISERVGYMDPHYFSRTFVKHEGISPKDYRKLSRVL